jgi:integrase
MARKPSIWFREATGWYMTTFRGEQVKLAKYKAEAERAFHALLAQAPEHEETGRHFPSFRKIADLFLDHAEKTKEKTTFDLQRLYLQSFCDSVKKKRAADIKVADVTAWLLEHTAGRTNQPKKRLPPKKGGRRFLEPDGVWGHNTQVTCRAVVRACLNWAVDQGYLTHNPLGRLKAGSYHRRERILTVEERVKIKALIRDRAFREFVLFLEQTGARPFSEAAIVTREMIDFAQGTITFTKHKNARKGKTRTIYMTDGLREVLARRCREHLTGPLFTTRNGMPFSGPNTVQRIRRFEARLDIPRFSLYSYRHSYITDALERGLSSDIVAELVGNTPKTIARYYSHLDQKKNTMRDAARIAVGN